MARNMRLLSRILAQPMTEVSIPREAAMVPTMSSGRLATQIISMFCHASNQVRRMRTIAPREYRELR
jgi:hypothetical protein